MQAIARNTVGKFEIANDLTIGDLGSALTAGWRDFKRYPQFGLFFAAIFIGGGGALAYLLFSLGQIAWLIPATAGFPLLAPFAAAGLYEVSRRCEGGEELSWKPVLGAVKGGDGQLPVMGVIAFVIFSFWVILAHTVFGVFLGQSGLGSQPVQTLLSPAGLSMLAVGSAIGGMVALFLFSMMVISLPLLIGREVDFITAIVVSFRSVQLNLAVMLTWAALVATLIFAAMVPAFLGLFVVLPVLGHATWHLYRRVVR